MSYGLKYKIDSFRDSTTIGNNLWRIYIYSNGYGGSASALSGTETPIVISYKKNELITPTAGSECTVGFYATSLGQYDEFLTAAPLQYWLQVYKSTDNGSTYNLYWQGVNTTDTFSQKYGSAPYAISLKFNCGLGELQFHRYEQGGNLFESYEQVIQILNNCFAFLPYALNIREIINIREDTMNDALGLLEQLYLDDAAFYEIGDDQLTHGLPCMKVLQLICQALNCRIYQSNNTWYMERIYERVNTSVVYYDYTTGAQTTANTITHSATGTLNWTRTVNNAAFPKILASSEKQVTVKHPVTLYTLKTDAYNNDELIPNPFFEDTPTGKDANGEPLRWDRSANVISHGGDQIKLISPYEVDPRYRWAYTFGTTNCTQSRTQCDASTSKWYAGSMLNYPSTYDIHAVLRTGDTYTRPWVYVDKVNGSLQINIQLFIEIQIQTLATAYKASGAPNTGYPTLSQLSTACMDNIGIYPYFRIGFKTGSSVYYLNSLDASKPPALQSSTPAIYATNFITLRELFTNCWYPNDDLTPVSVTQITTQLLNSAKTNTPFSFKFRYSTSFNVPLSTLASSGIYEFDCVAYAAYYDKNSIKSTFSPNPNPLQSWIVQDYGFNAIDVQYKDTFLSASPYAIFYAASDTDTRWNELKIDVQLGDSLTPGYPGSFRLSTGAQTGTWHNKGVADTGQVLADILFKKFAQIPAVYRNNIKGHIFDNSLQYYMSLVDEDGTVYIQLGHDLDVKKCAYQTDMEGMADTGLTITPTKGIGTTPLVSPTGYSNVYTPPSPIHLITTTPLTKTASVLTVSTTTYPSSS